MRVPLSSTMRSCFRSATSICPGIDSAFVCARKHVCHDPGRKCCNVARLSENSERLYESDNGVLG